MIDKTSVFRYDRCVWSTICNSDCTETGNWLIACCWTLLFALSALTLLVGWQEEHSACKNWVVGCWRGYLSGVRCRLAYGPAICRKGPERRSGDQKKNRNGVPVRSGSKRTLISTVYFRWIKVLKTELIEWHISSCLEGHFLGIRRGVELH